MGKLLKMGWCNTRSLISATHILNSPQACSIVSDPFDPFGARKTLPPGSHAVTMEEGVPIAFPFRLDRPAAKLKGMSDVSRLIDAATAGDLGAAAQLLPLVYDELRRLAADHLARE